MSRRQHIPKLNTLAAAAAAALGLAASPAQAASCSWNTAAGNWNAVVNWLACATGNGNPAGTPGGADTATVGATGTVTVSTSQAIRTLVNAGTVNVLDNVAFSLDARNAAAGVSGNGQLVLGGPGTRLFVEGGQGVTLGAGSTIRGVGQIGQAVQQGGASVFANNGTLSADTAGQSLMLLSPGNAGSYVNNGLMEARNGGTLDLRALVQQTGTGSVRAETGSIVLVNGTTVAGGILGTAGTGAIQASNNQNNLLSGVTLNGTLDMASQASQLRLRDGLVLDGSVNVGSSSSLYLDNRNALSQTLGGSGTIALTDARLFMEGNGQTTLGSSFTVRGSGDVGQAVIESGAYTLANNGLISADQSGKTLQLLRPGNGPVAIQNNGILEAINGGRLLLSANIDASASSQMRAGAGSAIEMNGVTVTGTVNTTGSGSFRASNNQANLLSGVTLNGTMDLASQASQLRIRDGLVLNGTVDVGSSSSLYLDNRSALNQSLAGTGAIVLTDARLFMEGNGQTTLGATTVVRGSGEVGRAVIESGAYTLVNNGLVSADVAGATLQLLRPGNGGVAIQNNGILEAVNGGRLLLSADINAAPGSQMRAGAGSVIEMNGVTVTGTVNTTGSGSFRASNNPANLLSGVTLNGTMDLASQASQLRIRDGLVLNGTVNVGSSSSLYLDNRSALNQSLAGTGTIVLTDARLFMEGNGQTTLGATTVVRGSGEVGRAVIESGAYTLVNNGLIAADMAGRTLQLLRPGNGPVTIQNNGTLRAAGGGTLQLSANIVGGVSSSYDVDAASTVLMNGVGLSGVVKQTGSGFITASNDFNNGLAGVSLSGRVVAGHAAGAGQLRISDGLTMNSGATIAVGANGVLFFDNRGTAAQTVSGNGQIVLGGGALRMEGGSSTTWDSGITVRGSGSIGQATVQSAAQNLINHGTLVADGGALNIVPIANGGALQGTGTLRVDGGALSLGTGRTTNQGTLDIRAAGTLALGTQNLVLSNDYTNAQAGSGNSFDRRAGVSGTGQIVAGGDVAQVIGGANVTGGSTPNATLTIGNVRVGANTFAYTIGNAGSTGPTLRGAVQTNVNGANLSDTRLSGSGVTAGNYNAGAPGGSGEARSVVFTVGSAGALAPLSGQVLNLRSNFENIADQKLNIVLASGAAAYNAAVGSTATPVQVANQRVGGTNTATLAIGNTAAPGAFSEDLNASIASLGGQASASGSVAGRLAGTGNTGTGAITVGVDSSSAGAKTGVVNLNYQSTGTVNGVSNGLGAIGVGGQTVTVNGNVYLAASGQLLSTPLNFGTVQVGQAVFRDIVVRNNASGAAGFVEDLNVAFGAKSGSGTALFDGTGSLAGILAGATSNAGNGTMRVNVNTAHAGTISGSIAINYTSAGAVGGVSNGLGTLAVGSDSLGVAGTIDAQANVVNQASPQFGNTSVNLGAVRVGAAAPTASIQLTNQSVGAPQAALSATIASNGAPVTASGAVSLLGPGASSSALQVGLNTAVAGNFTGANAGSATVTLVSDASNVGNCAPNCTLNLPSQQVSVQGKVYTTAVGQASGGPIDFGIVRVGDTVSARNITITNAAAATALNDTLRASGTGLSGPVTLGSAVGGLGAGASGNLAVMLSTASAGTVNQTAQVSFLSQNPDMADVSAGPDAAVQVMATINNLANADFDLLSSLGSLSDDGNGHYVLNLGTLNLGDARTLQLQLDNDVSGPADRLRGSFNLAGVDDFTLGGFGDVSDLAGGAVQGGLTVGFTAAAVGLYSDTVDFAGRSFNASDTQGLAQARSLRIVATVVDPNGGGSVPEPGTLALVLGAALLAARRRKAR